MKKLIAITLAAAAIVPAMAEGYQVNTLSARQNGMGHTGTALKLGSESMIFNPAGMAFLKDRVDFRATMTGIIPTAKATVNGVEYKNANTTSTPFSANLGMRVYDNLAVGVSMYTPYGSKIDWTDNWPGAELSQRVNLAMFSVQPTVAWRPVKNLAVGAGVMVSWGRVALQKGLINPKSLDLVLAQQGIPYRFDTTMPASLSLTGKSAVTAGLNVGAMWDINKQWTVGTSWRQQMKLKVAAGQAKLTYANEIAQQVLEQRLGLLHEANFASSLPAPWVWNVGVGYKPTNRLTLALDAQLTGWKAYDALDVTFLDPKLQGYNQHIDKKYRNSWTFKAGAEYGVTDRLDLRCGVMVDQSPVNKDYYNPETPGMTKVAPSVGLTFEPLPNFAIDASVLYVAGLGADGSCPVTDLLMSQIMQKPVVSSFKADYKVSAWAPSIGFALKF